MAENLFGRTCKERKKRKTEVSRAQNVIDEKNDPRQLNIQVSSHLFGVSVLKNGGLSKRSYEEKENQKK